MTEEMDAEFDTVAEWTADVALDLGPAYHEVAGCRGSGGPGVLRWMLDELDPRAGALLLDCGAGVGGPAAIAARQRAVRPLLVEPEAGACRAARRLFGLPTVRAAAQAIPLPDAALDLAWSIAVLCTVDEQAALLGELRRVVRDGGPVGLLVYVRTVEVLPEQPAGNHFPTRDELASLVERAGLRVQAERPSADLADDDPQWERRADEVESELARRHGDDPAWRTAEEQAGLFGRLVGDGLVEGRALVLRAPR